MFYSILYPSKTIKENLKNKQDLDFIDSILSYLLSDKMSEKSINNIIKNCSLPKQYEKSFNLTSQVFQEDKTYIETIYKKILNKLIKDNLIINDNSKYSLDYEGIMLMVNGGILQKEINLKRKELIQNLIWKVTLVAFVINLLFQMLNLYIRYY